MFRLQFACVFYSRVSGPVHLRLKSKREIPIMWLSLICSASTALLLHRLTIFAVNSGTWTAIFAVLSAVLVRIL